jgi:polyhydroxyalkanoate synthesis regulator phasin
MSNLLNQAKTILTVAKDTAKTSVTAGFGVYGTILDEASKSSDKATQIFESLVERGTQVEPQVKEQVSALFSKKISLETIETKAQSITSRFTGDQGSKISEVEGKIDQLTAMIAELNTVSNAAPKKVVKAKETTEA